MTRAKGSCSPLDPSLVVAVVNLIWIGVAVLADSTESAGEPSLEIRCPVEASRERGGRCRRRRFRGRVSGLPLVEAGIQAIGGPGT